MFPEHLSGEHLWRTLSELRADNFIYDFQIIFVIFVINYAFEDFLRFQFFCNLVFMNLLC